MRISAPIFEPASQCGYLPHQRWRLEYRLAAELSPLEYAELLRRGWRHFGHAIFRPSCPSCTACVPIRVDVAHFQPNRSQRRAWRANAESLTITIAEPTPGPAQLDLYRRYHAHQEATRDWPDRQGETPVEYAEAFTINPFPVQEWRYNLGSELVGIGYVDPLPIGPSAITFIHDPAHRDRSLGTYNVLALIAHARDLAQPHVYLGYHVAGCGSMAYKARFLPHELLQPDGQWHRAPPDHPDPSTTRSTA